MKGKWDYFWMIWLLVIILIGLLTSCRTKYVAVPEWHTEYVYHSDTLLQRDSFYVKDSVFIEKNGDTITIHKTSLQYRDRWRDKIVYRDSIKVDSIRVPYPVERELTFWQKSVLKTWWIGAFAIVLLIGLICLKVIRWLRARSMTS